MTALLASVLGAWTVGSEPPAADLQALRQTIDRLRPLHREIRPPAPGDWLSKYDEAGQTFEQYRASGPTTPRGDRHVLYVQPVGKLSGGQRRVVELTAEYLGAFFNLPVRTRDVIPLAAVPPAARRVPQWGDEQILTTWVMTDLLAPRLPDDAAAMIALTASDLWAGAGWNYVFGQASVRGRVGVWSIHRNGDPDAGRRGFRTSLMRTVKVAVHETSHMFSVLHCTAYECIMCGANHQQELDRRPVHLCPECHAKICWATGAEPVARYRQLRDFWQRHGFDAEARFFERSIRRLGGEPHGTGRTPK